jgi:hypothetical protein
VIVVMQRRIEVFENIREAAADIRSRVISI